MVLACFAAPITGFAIVNIPTVTVRNVGNAADTRLMNDGTTGYGQVNYNYSIGKYEVTAAQYTAFLNSVAATDTYGLYNPEMATNAAGCKIIRSGTSGSYTYSVASDYANRPVNYVSWGDAARFSNWLANGQPVGTQDASTTEAGSYVLNGATSATALLAVSRNASATWFISSENEWYKAAFYNPITGAYYEYATSSNTLPSNQLVNPDPGNNANYRDSASVNTLGSPYYRTEVGEFENSDSPYGTFDQNGNVWEWNESTYFNTFREMRGGAVGTFDVTLSASFRYIDLADYEANTVGFRVASSIIPSVPGDFNDDSLVDANDIDLLFGAAQGAVPPALAKFDVTGDNNVNSLPNSANSDADYWVRILKSTEYGDTNLDGDVNFDDLLVLAQNYGASTGSWSQGDMDGTDGVAFDDLLLLAQHYGFGALSAYQIGDLASLSSAFVSDWQLAQSIAPEPLLAGMSMMLFVARKRRT